MFQKGKPRLPNAGRQKGSPNKVTADIRARLQLLVDGQFDEFLRRMRSLSNADYCDMYIKVLPFLIAKQRELSITAPPKLDGFRFVIDDNRAAHDAAP